MSEDKFKHSTDPATRLAELRSGGPKKPAAVDADAELVEAEELSEAGGESFSVLSAARMQKMMLELRFRTDDADAFPYSLLVRAKLDKSKDILLDFSIAEVRISGRRLRPLYAAIVAQRAAFVQEMDDLYAEAELEADATVVTAINVIERKITVSEEPEE